MEFKRKENIIKTFGRFYGLVYAIAYWLHKNCYIRIIGKRVIKLKYKKHNMYIRLFSRDLDFLESIFIGKNAAGGEYDLKNEGNCNAYLDLGANIGLFSILYAEKYPKRVIVAVEPEEHNFALLKRNTKDFKNVKCVRKAIWYRNSYVKVYESIVKVQPSNTPSEGGFFVGECSDKDENSVLGITINDIVKKYNLKNYLVKMDIEGAEFKIFENGDKEWLKGCATLVMETHERLSKDYDEKIIFNAIKETHDTIGMLGENNVFLRKDRYFKYNMQYAEKISEFPFWKLVDELKQIEEYFLREGFVSHFRCNQLDRLEKNGEGKQYIVWGAGQDGVKAVKLLELLGKEISVWCDKNKKGNVIEGKKILDPHDMVARYKGEIIIIASRKYRSNISRELFTYLPDLHTFI